MMKAMTSGFLSMGPAFAGLLLAASTSTNETALIGTETLMPTATAVESAVAADATSAKVPSFATLSSPEPASMPIARATASLEALLAAAAETSPALTPLIATLPANVTPTARESASDIANTGPT